MKSEEYEDAFMLVGQWVSSSCPCCFYEELIWQWRFCWSIEVSLMVLV